MELKTHSENTSGTNAKKYEEEHFVDSTKPVWNYSLFTEEDVRQFLEWYTLHVVQ